MVAQVSAISYQTIVGEFMSGSPGTYLTNHIKGVPFSADTFLQDIVGAMCEGGVLGGALSLLGGPSKQCLVVLEGLIAFTAPEAEFAFALAGSMLCDEIVNGLLDGVPGDIENGLCNVLENAVGLSNFHLPHLLPLFLPLLLLPPSSCTSSCISFTTFFASF